MPSPPDPVWTYESPSKPGHPDRKGRFFLRIVGPLLHYVDVEHISDHDLERYHLGMVVDEAELASLEEHLLACPECVERAEQTAVYVDTLRAAIIVGNCDSD